MRTKSLILTLAVITTTGVTGALAQKEGDAKKPARPEGGRPPGGGDGPGAFFKQLDTDGDGKITQSEAGERWERVGRMDKNKDGAITKDELPQFGAGGPGAPAGGGQFFEKGDKNGDGKLSKDEVPAEAWERLGKADKNNDGAVTKEELAAMFREGGGRPGGPGAGGPGGLFEFADKNKDGKITQEEAGERWERISQLDKNGDGAVTKDEVPARPEGGKPGAGGPGAGGGGDRGAIFAQSDKNNDGKLGKDEVSPEMWERLSKADKNADGLVSKEELGAAYADRPGGGGGDKPKARPEGGDKPKPKAKPEGEKKDQA